MKELKSILSIVLLFTFFIANACKSQDREMEPEETEVWEPVPEKIAPGTDTEPPSDALVLWSGRDDLSKWQHPGGKDVQWEAQDGILTVKPGTGGIETRQGFGSVQLHIEWRAPEPARGEGQDRGNSGVFLHNRYEVQVLDSYNNKTYSNGMAGSIYKQSIPSVNAALPPGEWQTYDIVFIAPEFNDNGSVKSPARLTVFWNGVMVQNNFELKGPTEYIGIPEYEAYNPVAPISLQDHNHPVSFRNIWVRELGK